MILFLHNRYRTTGGEERVVEDLLWLVREQMGEQAQLLARDSGELGRTRAAAGLLAGGLQASDVTRAVRLSRPRVVHAHNLLPTLGWRALAAARDAGARVVLHLHQYRLVCAVGVCFTHGERCTRCHGRNTLPGVRLNCRGSVPESLAYAAALSLWQRRTAAAPHAVIVPSRYARERLRELRAPLSPARVEVLAPPLPSLAGPEPRWAPATEPFALVVSRLAPEKGVDLAIDACRIAGIALVIAGEGPAYAELCERVRGADVRFLGRVEPEHLARLRAEATIALVPSRAPETFGMAAAEAMAAGLPVAATRVGALPELLEDSALADPDSPRSLAGAIARLAGDRSAGRRNLDRVRETCAPERVATRLGAVYDG